MITSGQQTVGEPISEGDQICALLGRLYGAGAGPEAGVLVYYALLDDGRGEAPPALCAWVLSADGRVQFYQGAGAADGRSLNEAAADLHEKVALLAHAHTTRGAKGSAAAHAQQKEELTSRGVLQEGGTLRCISPLHISPISPLHLPYISRAGGGDARAAGRRERRASFEPSREPSPSP